MKEQKQPAKTTIISKKVAKKVQFFQKNWEIGQPSQTIGFFVYRNPSEASTKLIGGVYKTSQIFVHAEMITSNDQKRDHTGWAMARGTCVESGKTTAHRKRHISKSTTFPTAAYQPYAKNNRKSPVSKQQFFPKKLQKNSNFPKKRGNRTTIPDNLIVCVSQSIGGFHEISQIFAHASRRIIEATAKRKAPLVSA